LRQSDPVYSELEVAGGNDVCAAAHMKRVEAPSAAYVADIHEASDPLPCCPPSAPIAAPQVNSY